MEEKKQEYFTGERALFQASGMKITDSVFEDGESPLKHSRNLDIDSSFFKWKYPLWYSEDIRVDKCALFENARAGIWYTKNISVSNTVIEAPKNFRRCDGVSMKNVNFTNAAETLWNCRNVTMENVTAKGDYFAMNCEEMEINGLRLTGNYCFDGAKNLTLRDCVLMSKDAFWNCENVTVFDSFISGEYLAWDSKNITFVNCTIESLQGMCFVENLTLKNCKLLNTTLAFEYSTVDAEVTTSINSIKNPWGGTIRAKSVGEIILESDRVDTSKTTVICEEK